MSLEPAPPADVRMHGFPRRHTVAAALAWLDAQLQPLAVRAGAARGRGGARARRRRSSAPSTCRGSTARRWTATRSLPTSTEGAGAYSRLPLTVVGDSMPGRAVRRRRVGRRSGSHHDGRAAAARRRRRAAGRIRRRGAGRGPARLPRSKPCRRARTWAARARTSCAARGCSSRDASCGRRTSASSAPIGIAHVDVVRRPRVRLVITGNELLPAGSPPHGFHIADANGPMLAALVERDGGVVDFRGLVRDDAGAILEALLADVDVVIVSGGSSVGVEDLAPGLVAQHGELAVHGIAMRPSSPTGMGRIGHRLVFLLPGNPVSSLCAYDFFAGRAIRALGGRPAAWPYRSVRGAADAQDQFADRPPRLRARHASSDGARRAAGGRGRVGALVHDARRRLRDRGRRQRRLRRRRRRGRVAVCLSRSSSSRSSIATRPSAASAPRST